MTKSLNLFLKIHWNAWKVKDFRQSIIVKAAPLFLSSVKRLVSKYCQSVGRLVNKKTRKRFQPGYSAFTYYNCLLCFLLLNSIFYYLCFTPKLAIVVLLKYLFVNRTSSPPTGRRCVLNHRHQTLPSDGVWNSGPLRWVIRLIF